MGADERAEPLAEDDERCEHVHHQEEHGIVDEYHQDGDEQIVGADEEGVFEHVGRGVAGDGQQGKDIGQHDDIGDHAGEDARQQQRPYHGNRAGGGGAQPVQQYGVRADDQAGGQHDQPYDGGLPEILPEGAEEHGRDVASLVLGDLEGGVVERRRGRADGDDGQAADQPQDVQAAAVGQLQEKLPEFAVIGKESHGNTS